MSISGSPLREALGREILVQRITFGRSPVYGEYVRIWISPTEYYFSFSKKVINLMKRLVEYTEIDSVRVRVVPDPDGYTIYVPSQEMERLKELKKELEEIRKPRIEFQLEP